MLNPLVSPLCLFMNIFTTWCGWGYCGSVRIMGKHGLSFSSKTSLSHTCTHTQIQEVLQALWQWDRVPKKLEETGTVLTKWTDSLRIVKAGWVNIHKIRPQCSRNDSFSWHHINKILIKLKIVQTVPKNKKCIHEIWPLTRQYAELNGLRAVFLFWSN